MLSARAARTRVACVAARRAIVRAGVRGVGTREEPMKFMVRWSIDRQDWLPIMKKWSSMTPAKRADVGKGVSLIGRWHDMARREGVCIL
jgi:hypothetical protein